MDSLESGMEKAGYRASYAQKLRDIAATVSLAIDHRPTRRVRGLPVKSEKPWHILYSDGTLCASFRTLVALERNLRNRAGC